MSRIIAIINAVKAQCDSSWLTPSQCAVYEQLRFGFEHQRILNIYGEAGVGKTVLAWILEKEGYGLYTPDPTSLAPSQRRVLIDNLPPTRQARRLVDEMNDLHIAQAALFTNRRIDDDFPAFKIDLTAEDIAFCRATLYQKLGFMFPGTEEISNLHDLVMSLV